MKKEAYSATIHIAGYRAHVRVLPAQGREEAILLALHGFTGSARDWEPLREAIGTDRITWICPDFMGHGESEAPGVVDPYLLPNALRLIDRARLLASDPNRVILLGYSMGGRLALQYLLRAAPVKAAVVIGATPGIEDRDLRQARRKEDRARLDPEKESIDSFCEKWESMPLIAPQTRLPEPLCSELRRRRRTNRLQGLHNSLLACGAGALPSLWDRLAELPPLLCLYGGEDRKFAEIAHKMMGRAPQLSCEAVPEAGHAPHLENPAALANLLKARIL